MNFKNMLDEKYTLAVSLPQNSPELAMAAIRGGADALKIHINVEHRASGTVFKKLKEDMKNIQEILKIAEQKPTGIVLGGDITYPIEDLYEVAEMGFDFISLYAHHAKTEVLRYDKIDKMLAPDYTYDMNMIRVFAKLEIDILEASIMPPEEYGLPLTARDLMRYKIIRENTTLPIVIPTQKYIYPSDILKLKEIGMNGILIGAIVMGKDKKTIYETVQAFRKSIDIVNLGIEK